MLSVDSIRFDMIPGPFCLSLNDSGDRRRLPPSAAWFLLIVDDDDHPDAYLAVGAGQWSAVDPLVAALLVRLGDPAHFRSHSSPFRKCRLELLTYSIRATDLVEERRLQNAGYSL